MTKIRIEMLDIRHIIRLKEKGHSNRQIGKLLGINRNTVNRYTSLVEKSGQTCGGLLVLSDAELIRLLESQSDRNTSEPNARLEKLEGYFPVFSQEMKKVGVTYQALWQQYCMDQEDGYAYTQFRYYFKTYLNRQEVSLHWEHAYGDQLLMDFTGKKLPIVDKVSGEVIWQEVFVGILAGSGYTFVKAVNSQRLDDFLEVVQDCLRFFGGVPQALVVDNLKSAVSVADKYEAQVNRNFKALALHYDTTVLPTRSRKPKDKALVEGAVKLVYQRIFYALNELTFFGLGDLNAAILDRLEGHNNQHYQHKTYSRKDLFEQHEKMLLGSLPSERFERRTYREGRVNKDAHVLFDYHYYSVPYQQIRSRIFVQATARTVEIFISATHERIALHERKHDPKGYSTKQEHLPSNVRFVKKWSAEQFDKLAQQIGQDTQAFFQQIFEYKAHPQQAYKACMGILSLRKGFSDQRINAACKRADYFQNYTYKAIKNILEKGLDKVDYLPHAKTDDHPQLGLDHPNIRGGDYYK
jgi:transposase